MLPSTTSQAVVDFPSSGVSPSAMTAEAMAHDEDGFVDLYKGALAVTPPPSSNARSPQMQWGTALPFAGNAGDDDHNAAPAPASGSIEFGSSGVNPFSPPPPSSAPPTTLQANKQSLLPASSSSVAVSSVAATPTPVPPLPTARPPSAATAAPPRAAKPFPGPTKARAKGGARQPRRVKLHDDGDDDDDPEEGAPDHRVCLLAVGTKKQHLRGADGTVTVAGGGGGGGGGAMDSGASLDDVIGMLTAEINRNGREAETERVETGERAVLQVRALARSELRYGIVLLEVEGSRAAAIATARELKAANPSTPIIAVAYPRAMLTPAQLLSSEGWRDFNEILPFPVSAATVRGLATRYLLAPPGVAAAAASSGMAGEPISSGPSTAAATFGQLGQHTAGSGSCCGGTLVPSLPVAGGSGEVQPPPQQQQQHQQQQGTGAALSPHGVAWSLLPDAEEGVLLPSQPLLSVTNPCARRVLEGLARPRAAMTSPSSSSPTTLEETLASLKRRVFGGSEEDRALPCGLFGEEFEMKNAEIEDREYDFVFRHGTILVRVEEGLNGEVVPMVFSLCEYATDHFGDLTGLPLQWLFHEDATNKKTAAKIMIHIERSDSDSMCCYVNLKSKVRRWTSSFVSIRSLSKRPERAPEQRFGHERLPPWYVLLKVCLPSALGLIKEPELLQQLYSRKAAETSKRAAPQKGRSKVGAKKSNKKARGAPVAGGIQSREGVSSEAST